MILSGLKFLMTWQLNHDVTLYPRLNPGNKILKVNQKKKKNEENLFQLYQDNQTPSMWITYAILVTNNKPTTWLKI